MSCKPLSICVINNDEDPDYCDPIVKILSKAMMDQQHTWTSAFTEDDKTTNVKLFSRKKTSAQDKPKSTRGPINICVVYWKDLKSHKDGKVEVTYTSYTEAKCKVEETKNTVDIESFDGIVISDCDCDANINVNIYADMLKTRIAYFNWMLTTKIPTLSIGIGHHLYATLLNIPLHQNQNQNQCREIGNLSVSILKDDPIFNGLKSHVVLESFDKTTREGTRKAEEKETCCGMNITVHSINLPLSLSLFNETQSQFELQFEILAKSSECPIQIMRCCRRNCFYSIEFLPYVHNHQFFYNFLHMIENPPLRVLYTESLKAESIEDMFITENVEACEAKGDETQHNTNTKLEEG